MDTFEDANIRASDVGKHKRRGRRVRERKPKKIKKGGVAALIIVSILLLLIGAPIATIYGCFFDNTSIGFKPDPNFDLNTAFDELPYNSVEHTRESPHEIRFEIDESYINNIIHQKIMPAITDATNKLVSALIFDIDGVNEKYHTIVAAGVPIFQTRAYLDIGFELLEDDPVYGDAYVFTIEDIRLGRVSLKDLLGSILDMTGKADDIDTFLEDTLATSNVHVACDIANYRLIYPKTNMIEDLSEIVNTSSLYKSFLDGFFDMGMEDIDFFGNDGISVVIDLTDTDTNELYCTDSKKNPKFTTTFIDNPDYTDPHDMGVIQLIESAYNDWHSLDIDEIGEADALFNYFTRGYKLYSLNDDYNLNGLFTTNNFTPFYDWAGISDYTEWNGAELPDIPEGADDTVTAALKAQIKANLTSTFTSLIPSVLSGTVPTELTGTFGDISEDQVNEVLKSSSVLGFCYLLKKIVKGTDGKQRRYFNYIAINNFYMNIYEDASCIVIGTDINGFETAMCIPAEKSSTLVSAPNQVNFKIGDTYLGKKKTASKLQDLVFELVKRGLEQSNEFANVGWIHYNEADNDFTFDFSKVIENAFHEFKADLPSTTPPALLAFIDQFYAGLNVTLTATGAPLDDPADPGLIHFDYVYHAPTV